MPQTDYDTFALREVDKGNVKLVRVVRRLEKGKYKFYCQLTINMRHPEKMNAEGEFIHTFAKGRVGLNIWRDHVAAVSADEVKFFELSPNREKHLKKVEEMARELEAMRRELNPQNYEEDGQIKRGLMIDGKRQRLKWNYSLSYKALKKALQEEHRVYAETLKIHQRKLVYELLAMGNQFVLFDTSSYITKKLVFDIENRLKNSEYRKKAERRRSIEHNAPSQFLQFLNAKLSMYEYAPVERINVKEELYWYRHDMGNSDKEYLNSSLITINGCTFEQTIYRAYLILFYDGKKYDQSGLMDNFDNFLALL